MTLTWKEGDDILTTRPAIYEIDKYRERMILCLGKPKGMRPTSFDTKNTKHTLYILVRKASKSDTKVTPDGD
jgi:hypothetical protein